MKTRKIERAMEMVRIGMGKAEITRALNFTKADWRDFFKYHGDEDCVNFTDIKAREDAKITKERVNIQLARARRPVDFIKLNERGMEQLKQTLLENQTRLFSGNCRFDFATEMKISPYAMRANNGMAYFTISAREHGGYRGDSIVISRFPNMLIYLLGHADIVDTVPADIALRMARIKLEGDINRTAISNDIGAIVRDATGGEIIVDVSEPVKFSSTHQAIDYVNAKNMLAIDKSLFLNDVVDSGYVTIRANPEGPLQGAFPIRTRIQK